MSWLVRLPGRWHAASLRMPKPGEKCHVDEQMGFIKFGSRVDVYLPVGTEVLIEMDQK